MLGIYAKEVDGIWFGAACDEREIFATTFTSNREKALRDLSGNIPSNIAYQRQEKASGFTERVIITLKEIYDGKEPSSSFPLAMEHLSDHTKKVLKVTSLIPRGYVSSYGCVAEVAGSSPRGVGRVMARNPFAPIVPCHRVVGSDFSLVGYGGGVNVKLAFLERESKGFKSKKDIRVDSKKLIAFPIELVLKKNKRSCVIGKPRSV